MLQDDMVYDLLNIQPCTCVHIITRPNRVNCLNQVNHYCICLKLSDCRCQKKKSYNDSYVPSLTSFIRRSQNCSAYKDSFVPGLSNFRNKLCLSKQEHCICGQGFNKYAHSANCYYIYRICE